MITNRKLGLLVMFAGLILLGLKFPLSHDKDKVIHIGSTAISTLIADTPELQDKGLGGRYRGLPPNTGMLFVFEKEGNYGFWMKDMNFALDIVWIDTNQKIIGIEKNVTPDTYPKVFYPPAWIKFVLELPAGFTVEQGIKIGDKFSPTL